MRQFIKSFLSLLAPTEQALLYVGLILIVPFYGWCWYWYPSWTFFWTLLINATFGLIVVGGVVYTGFLRSQGHYLSDIHPDAPDDDAALPEDQEWPSN